MSAGINASQAFVPNKFANLIGWWDATDRATVIDSGGAVSQWIDKSRNSGDVTQSVEIQKPEYVLSSINGLPAVVFNGVDAQLLIGTFSSFTSGAKTILEVFQSDTLTSTRVPVFIGSTAAAEGFCLLMPQDSARFTSFVFGGQQARIAPNNVNPNIAVGTVDAGGNVELYINGVIATIFVTPPSAINLSNDIAFGGSNGAPSFPYQGRVGEIIIYDRVLPDLERMAVESYLSNKWSITLP